MVPVIAPILLSEKKMVPVNSRVILLHSPNYSYPTQLSLPTSMFGKKTTICRWKGPPPGVFAINCDGSFHNWDKSRVYGVIVRNYLGQMITAKANHCIKLCPRQDTKYGISVLMHEMTAIRDGLRLASLLQLRRVEVQTDSKYAIDIFSGKWRCPRECLELLFDIQSETRNFERVGFVFVYRESNRAADFLSKVLVKDDEEKFFYSSDLPIELRRILEEDALGFLVARNKKNL